jgi:hypothetical protein
MFDRLFKRTDLSSVELLFISKDDCHLCDEALEVVEAVRRKHPFRLRVVKITKGDEWYDRFWDKIPVGLVDGGMIFKYRVTADELLVKLRARAAG